MDEIVGVAFWSYTHEDDRLDDGNIVALAQKITNAYSLITGGTLQLFIDRDISWGEEWRSRIEGALSGTTFFIPIITPRYFARPECRRELSTFHAKAEGGGVGELLMPILYSPVKEFNERNSDELIALTSRYQYEDWTSLRLEDLTGALYRRAVDKLARRLVETSEAITLKQVQNEVVLVEGGEEDGPGLYELAEELTPVAVEFLEALETYDVSSAQFDAVTGVYQPRLSALRTRGADPKSQSNLVQRWAKELMPVADRLKVDSLAYDRVRLGLDPAMERIFRLLREHPDQSVLFEPLWVALGNAERSIKQELQEKLNGGILASDYWQRYEHMSQLTRQLGRTFRETENRLTACNDSVTRWIVDWHELEQTEGWGSDG